jgi:hypothetical protein
MHERPKPVPPRRLFRADTPADVFCAAIVAGTLPPGRNVLAVCRDKGRERSSAGWEAAFDLAARAFAWDAVVDHSGLPLGRHLGARLGRLARLRDTRTTARELRARIGSVLADVDALLFTLPSHPDVQLLYQLYPKARKYYYPHTFASLQDAEHVHHAHLFDGGSGVSVADRLKRRLLEPALVPVRRMTLDGAFTFNITPPWEVPTHDLGDLLTPKLMTRLFGGLSDGVRAHFERLAADAGRCAVLFLEYRIEGEQPEPKELAAYEYLTQRVIEAVRPASLIVKPHPRGPRAWSDAIQAHLSATFGDLRVVDASEHRELPAEVLLSPFDLAACVGLATTALPAFARIYGLPALFSPELAASLAHEGPFERQLVDIWIRSGEDTLTAI